MTPYLKRVLLVLTAALLLAASCPVAYGFPSDTVVVFNEIMYHPEVDEANLEWVELYNQLVLDVDLSGWSIQGGIRYDFPQGTIIPADGYVVVAISPSALKAASGCPALGPFSGRLDNSGEQLLLINNNDRVMDVLDYRDDGEWPVAPDGSGVSLAKYDPLSASQPPTNWRPSPIVGGTPGKPNFPSSGAYVPQYDEFLQGADQAKVLIPADGSLGSAWRWPEYDDSSQLWTPATTSIGFDLNDSFLLNHALNKPVINGSGAYRSNPFNVPDAAGNFTAQNVTDGSTSDVFGVNYWLGREATLNEYFILDLDNIIGISQIRLRNTHNTQYNDRGTADFQIWVSTEIDQSKQLVNPRLILSGTLTNVNGMSQIPADVFDADRGLVRTDARYVKFIALTANNAGNNVGLNEIEIYGSAVAADIEDLMLAKNATAYIRIPFNVANALRYDRLTLGMQYNDGFVAYLNGVKIEERNAPQTISWDSSATAENPNHQAVVFESFDVSSHLGLLRQGDNLLAVHGLNLSPSDPDFLICPRLTARFAPIAEYESTLAINEIPPAGADPFCVELYNYGSAHVDLQDFILQSSAGPTATLSGDIAPGEYRLITLRAFTASAKDKLFLYTPSRLAVADAATVADRLKGRLPASPPLAPFQYPAQPTPGAVNLFELNDSIVINEIMYHHRPQYEQSVPTTYTTTTLIPFDAHWQYDESGNDLGTLWKEPAADFSAWSDGLTWPQGPGLLGNETASLAEPIRTQLSLQGQTTYYFRKTFVLDSDAQNAELQFYMLIDDGAIFYLNGTEVHRHNMDDGPVNYLTRANPGVANATLVGPVVIPVDLLDGLNFLAVEVHQQAPTSSDVVFGLEVSLSRTVSEGGYVPFSEIDQEWIELYNRSQTPVDLAGWRLQEAVEFEFPTATQIAPGDYLVIAKDAAALRMLHPDVNIIGDYSQRLSNANERILLLDSNGNVADEVHYYDKGKWPQHADGGGSSLELMDPFADNANPQAWSHSDERSRSEWNRYTYTAVATAPVYNPPIYFHEFVLGLLDSGQVLLDNISVIENPDSSPIELIQNGSFQNDAVGQLPAKWRIQGTHDRSAVITDPDNPANKVLHLIADGPSNYLCNHAETTLAGGRTVVNGREYQISFDAKWIAGSPQLRTELYYCNVPRTTIIQTPPLSGTPGRRNSTWKTNIGPTFANLKHEPLIPSSDDPVTVSVTAADPDGVSAIFLWYSVNGGSWTARTMTAGPDSRYTAVIPPQANHAVVQFYVAARDTLNVQTSLPAKGPNSRALYKVDNAFSIDPLRRDFRFIMTPADADFLHLDTNLLSNNRLGTTVVYNNKDVYYDVAVRLKGSMFSRTNINGIGYNIRFHPDEPFRGVHETVTLRGNSRRELLPKLIINQSGGIPGMYDDVVRLTSPKGIGDGIVAMAMARYGDVFLESQYENGQDGAVFKMEGIRVMQTTVDGNPESLKIYMPIGWMPQFDIADLGDDKELYRWVYKINCSRAKDDYSRIIDMAKAFSLTGPALQQAVAQVLDVDTWMRQFALTSLCGIGDTYSQGNPHNLNFYVRPSDNKVLSMPWDWDFDFNLSASAPLWGNKNIAKVISLPPNKRLFMGHMHDMINTTYNTEYMSYWITHYSQIAGMNFGYVASYINVRSAHVLSLLPPEIPFRITTNDGADFSVDDDGAVLHGDGWINVRSIYVSGSDKPLDVEWLDDKTWRVIVPLQFGPNHVTLTARDFCGAEIASQTITVTSTVDERPLRQSLRLTELMYNPIGGTAYEFIELQNTGGKELDVRNVTLVDGGSQNVIFAFAAGPVTTLAPREHVLIVNDLKAFAQRYDTSQMNIAGEFTGNLSNSGERLIVRDRWNADILSFEYSDQRGWPLAADGPGHSLVPLQAAEEKQTAGSLDYGGNWRASAYIHGSPGQTDPCLPPTIVINEIMAHTDYHDPANPQYDSNDWIELLNCSDAPIVIAAETWYLSDDKAVLDKWALPAIVIPARGILSFDEVTGFHNPLTQGFGLNKAGEQVFLSCLPGAGPRRVVDCIQFKSQENSISLGRFPDGANKWHAMPPSRDLPNLPPIRNVFIREFMYHPETGGYEYIILHNPTSSQVVLWDDQTGAGWRLAGGISLSFDQSSTVPAQGCLFVPGFELTPANLDNFAAVYGSVPANRTAPCNGALSNGGERIALEKPHQSDDPARPNDISWMIVDEVIYFDDCPWPPEADGLGKALRRKGLASYGNAPEAWFAAEPMSHAVSGDFNADGAVNLADFTMLARRWLNESNQPDWDWRYQLHETLNGEIGILDLIEFAEQWLWSTSAASGL